MKPSTTTFFLLGVTLLFSSCAVKNYIAPPFTDVNKILRLKPGQTSSEVSDILRIDPYDIVHSYETGSMILVYNYRVKDRKMQIPSRAVQQTVPSEGAQREGDIHYNTMYRELYLLFANDTLKSVFGERTFSEGSYIEMVDNHLVASSENNNSTNVNAENDYLFMRNLIQERTSFRKAARIEEDEALKRRRGILKNIFFGVLGVTGLLGILGI